MTAVWWVRRDLRLHDSPALSAALGHGSVVPAFILDERLLRSRSVTRAAARTDFLLAGLHELARSLASRGSRLVVRRGDPARELARLAKEAAASHVYGVEDVTSFAKRRDLAVAGQVRLTLLPGATVVARAAVLKSDGEPYAQFAPFNRAWRRAIHASGPRPTTAPAALPAVPPTLQSDDLPLALRHAAFPAGEQEALSRIDRFIDGAPAPVARYAEDRDLPSIDATSALSPYFRFGMLSPRLAAAKALERLEVSGPSGPGPSAWLDELAWRDFFLTSRPISAGAQADAAMPWRDDASAIHAWCEGRTGIPIVDAGMRQLRTIGWMHNRVRMLTASFLVKNLMVDWRVGEQWFMDQLIDGDPTVNRGNWLWVAGVGPSAAPYFRVFNPTIQAQRFDPDGAYVRRWVPELRSVRDNIHEPWRLGSAATDYPPPIVGLAASRARYLEAYRVARRAVSRPRN